MPDILLLLGAGIVTALATGLGAIPVFFLGERAKALRPGLIGLAVGLMSVASVVGLLLPALHEGAPAAVAAGVARRSLPAAHRPRPRRPRCALLASSEERALAN